MALAATSIGSPGSGNVIGSQRLGIFNVTVGTYTTNGLAYTPALFGLNRIDFLQLFPASGYVFETDYTNLKVKAYDQKDPGNAGGADIALPEVGNSTNLGSVVARAIVIGV
jgi:hypothetical protein